MDARSLRCRMIAATALVSLYSLGFSAGATTVSGHVTDSLTHQPIANASVAGSTFVYPGLPVPGFNTQADAAGFYQVDVPANSYSTVVSANSYLTFYSSINVGSDPVVTDFTLAQPASISGAVRAGAAAIAYASVYLFDADLGSTEGVTSSEIDGTYLFDGLAPGTYAICVIEPNDSYLDQCDGGFDIPASGTRMFTPLGLPSGGALNSIDFDLHVGATITGTLSDSLTAAPLTNGAHFVLYSSSQTARATIDIPADPDGKFAIGGVPAGDYYLEAGTLTYSGPVNNYYVSALHAGAECHGGVPPCVFTPASLFSVPAGGTAAGIDFQLRPGHLVSGKITDAVSGLGVAGVTIKACEWIGLIRQTAETVSAADGTYTLAHVVGPGQVSVYTANALGYVDILWPNFPYYGPSWCTFEGSGLTFNSFDQNTGDVDFALTRAGSISGHVSPSALGSSAAVKIMNDIDGTLYLAWFGNPDPDGYYHADHLPPGTYYALVYFDAYQDCRVYAGNVCADPSASPPLDPQQATPITITGGQAAENIDFPATQEIFSDSFE